MSEAERRRAVRLPAEVKVDYRTVGSFITDYSRNLSQGGTFVNTSMPLPVGARVRLRLTLPGRDLPFALDGVVRWSREPEVDEPETEEDPGMGVEFTDFDASLQDALRRYVEELEHELEQ